MTLRSTATIVRALDGLRLAGTLVTPGSAAERAVVLVHGGGVTREEGGFFTRLAAGLGEAVWRPSAVTFEATVRARANNKR